MASILLIGFWLSFSLAIIVLALILTHASRSSQVFRDIILFGKVRGKHREWTVIQLTELPKDWFKYLYLIGFIINCSMSYLVTTSYLDGKPLPGIVQSLLYMLAGDRNNISTDALTTVILISMMAVQTFRRLYECLFVSVYSRSTINIFHFGSGVLLYSTFPLTVLVEAPDSGYVNLLSQMNWLHFTGLLVFVWASWHHHGSHAILSNLRKGKKGEVVSYDHMIPNGGWFEYVSCPHYLMEIIIYISFLIVSNFAHRTLYSVVVFVVSNQAVASLLTHSWYRKSYKNYPPQRKALIPYLL